MVAVKFFELRVPFSCFLVSFLFQEILGEEAYEEHMEKSLQDLTVSSDAFISCPNPACKLVFERVDGAANDVLPSVVCVSLS